MPCYVGLLYLGSLTLSQRGLVKFNILVKSNPGAVSLVARQRELALCVFWNVISPKTLRVHYYQYNSK